MSELHVDVRDVRFNLFDFLDVGALTSAPRYEDYDAELLSSVIDEAIKQGKEIFAPERQRGDQLGLTFEGGRVRCPEGWKKLYDKYAKAGWIGLGLNPEYGGQGAPVSVYVTVQEVMTAANISFLFMPGLTSAALNMLLEFGTPDQLATYAENMITGKWTGTMCLTEAGAGTAVPDLKSTAKAIPGREGFYEISGQKIFISAGDHDLTENIVHMFLAKIEDAPPEQAGVSLFIVPRVRVDGTFNDVNTVGIEHKMGIHASPTCTLSFGDEGACEGWLLGKAGAGLKCMFKMMNEARIAVGIQGVSHAALAYELAVRYAKERIQGVRIQDMRKKDAERVAIIEHPDVKRMLMHMKAIAQGARAMTYYAGYCADQALVAKDAEDAAGFKHWEYQLEILTPIVKAWCSDEGFRNCEMGMQVLGGYGYCSEFGMEQLARDVKIASIYEGTNGIQALDLLGRKVSRGGGVMLMTMLNEIAKFLNGPAKSGSFAGEVVELAKARDAVANTAMGFAKTQMKGDASYPAFHACSFLQMFGDTLAGWLLLRQAVKAEKMFQARLARIEEDSPAEEHHNQVLQDDAEARFLHGKMATARFFVHQIMPRVHARRAQIDSNDRSGLDAIL